MSEQSSALVKAPYQFVADRLTKYQPAFASLLAPFGMSGQRFARLALDELQRNPTLLTCEPNSLVRSIMNAAELGLELGSVTGSAYIVPFWNTKKKRREAQLIPGYKGLVHVAKDADRSIVSFDAEVVYEGDVFQETRGAHPNLVHEPKRHGERGERTDAYAIAFRKVDGYSALVPQFGVMTKAEIEAVKAASLEKQKEQWQKDASPWVKHESEMWKKTAVRRLIKLMDLTGDRARLALEADARDFGEEPAARKNRAAELKEKLGKVAEVIDAEMIEGDE